jgi:hypothetical protein
MSTPFVTELRTSDDVIVVGEGKGDTLHLRVQAAELWDAQRVDASASSSVASVKDAALASFFPHGASSPEFVVKVRGFEILDESESLAAAGIKDGSTLLIAMRRRRPVR